MENLKKSGLSTFLKVDFNVENDIWLTSTYTLRKIIGILGMALPVLLFVFLYFDSGLIHPLQSISHYYYTRVSSIFIVVLSLFAVFLIVYKGKEPVDFYISSIAGIFILLALFYPTSNISDICGDPSYSVTVLKISNLRVNFHYISAAIFLLCLSYMSLFLFTKSDKLPKDRGAEKVRRNRIYRTCGVIMIIAILIIFAARLEIISPIFSSEHYLTFWMETIAVESFGIAWLIKGNTLFKDVQHNNAIDKLP